MFKAEYDKIIRENFDLSDKYTRQYIAALEDAGQDKLLTSLSSALYDNIVAKVDDIDFGTIPTSRGDITKVEGFSKTEQCLDIIRRLVTEYKQSTAPVDVVITAIQNVKDRKGLFMKSYALNVELPMVLYNTVVLSIERSTSLMIATCIEYVKDPNSENINAALNKAAYQKSMDDVLFKQLISFNNMAANGTLDKVIDAVLKNPVKEDVEIDIQADPDTVEGPEIDSPITPDNTVDPFADPSAEEAPTEDSVDDTETSDECGDDPDCEDCYDDDDDIDLDAPIRLNDDNVEPDNIPTVNPGDDVMDSKEPINEENPVNELAATTIMATIGAIAGVGALGVAGFKLSGAIVNLFISLLRNLVYGIYYTSFKLSDCLAVQADLIEANANDLRYSTSSNLSDSDRKKTVKKQLKFADKLRKWSNKFALDSKKTNNDVEKAIREEDKKKKTIGKDEYNDAVILF